VFVSVEAISTLFYGICLDRIDYVFLLLLKKERRRSHGKIRKFSCLKDKNC